MTNVQFTELNLQEATQLTLTFSMLDLEPNYDYLYIYDGSSQNDDLIAVLNGTTTPAPIQSKTGKFYIEFRSDCGTTAAGWNANWSCSSQAPTCPAPTGLTTSNMTPNQVQLNWLSSNGASQYDIKTKRSVNNLPYQFTTSSTNAYDWVGIAANARYLWSVRAIYSNGDTSAWVGHEFYNASPVVDQTVTTCQGKFTDSGGQFGGYLNNENYVYVIAPNNGSSLQVTFNSFDLESNYDFLYIYDGANTSANLIGTYSGTNHPVLFNHLRVHCVLNSHQTVVLKILVGMPTGVVQLLQDYQILYSLTRT